MFLYFLILFVFEKIKQFKKIRTSAFVDRDLTIGPALSKI